MKNKSFLIVEDEMISSKYLKSILKSFHINIIYEAKSFEEALSIVENNHVDLVFMDINIQGSKDGIECAILLNKITFLPIIFTTAYGDTDTILKASNCNLYGYIIKPFEENDVEAILSVASKMIKKQLSTRIMSKKSKIDDYVSINKHYKYHLKNQTLTFKNIPVNLTKKELKVLNIFCCNINQNVSYEFLIEHAWDNGNISSSTIRDTVSRLKRKVSEINIKNVVNHGYILTIDPVK